MPWAEDTKTRIAFALEIPLHLGAFVPVTQAMQSIENLGEPLAQQSIVKVESLLSQWEELQAQIDKISITDSGLTRLDVIEWSDRAGAKLEDGRAQQSDLRRRIASALNLPPSSACGNGGNRQRTRS